MGVLERDFARLKEKVEILLGERGAAGRRAVRLEEVTRTVDRAVTAVKTIGRVAWDNVTGKPETFPPTAHTHPITAVTGLEEALANKASSIHTHAWSAITDKPTEFPPESHTHDFSEITGTVTVAWGDISGKPSTFPPDAHSHAWSEITSKPSTFPPEAHSHATSDVTGLDTALAGKAAASHTHGNATTSAAGFMSSADKTKLDGVATGANNYTHPTGDGNRHVPATGTGNDGRFLKAGATAASEAWAAIQQSDVVGLVAKITLLEAFYYSGFTVEAKALQDYLLSIGSPLSYARLKWLDEKVFHPLAEEDVLGSADRFYLPGRMPDLTSAVVNLANPGANSLSPVNSPVFTPDVGFVTDGVSSHLNPGFVVSTTFAGLKFQQDDAHLWARASDINEGNRPLVGQQAGSATIDLRRTNTGALAAYLNSSVATIGAIGNSGFFAASRITSTHVRGFVDGSFVSEQAATSTAPAGNRAILFMRGGGGSSYTAGTFEGGGMGAGLTDAQIEAMQAAFAAAWAETPPA